MSKIVNYQTASLVLQTINGTANNAALSSYTWNNVSLKTLLGAGMYEKYDLFNICLVQVSSAVANANLGASNNDLSCSMKLSGFNFQNQTFTTNRNTESGLANIGTINFVRGATTNQLFYSNMALTFRKQEYVNITIHYSTMDNDNLVNGNGQTYPPVTFYFQIVCVKEENYAPKNVLINTSRKPELIKNNYI